MMRAKVSLEIVFLLLFFAILGLSRASNTTYRLCPPGFVLSLVSDICELHPINTDSRNQSQGLPANFQSLYNFVAYPSLSLLPAPKTAMPASIIIINTDNSSSTSSNNSSNSVAQVEVEAYTNRKNSTTGNIPSCSTQKDPKIACSPNENSDRRKSDQRCRCQGDKINSEKTCSCEDDRSTERTAVTKPCGGKFYHCKDVECIGESCSGSVEVSRKTERRKNCCKIRCACSTTRCSSEEEHNDIEDCRYRIRKGNTYVKDSSEEQSPTLSSFDISENVESNDDIHLDRNQLNKLILSTITSFYNEAKTRIHNYRNQQKYKVHRNYHKKNNPLKRYKIHYNYFKPMEEPEATPPLSQRTKENHEHKPKLQNLTMCENGELCKNSIHQSEYRKQVSDKRINTGSLQIKKPDRNATSNYIPTEVKNVTIVFNSTTTIVTQKNNQTNGTESDYHHDLEVSNIPPIVAEEVTTHATGSFKDKLNKLLVAPIHKNPVPYSILQSASLEHARTVIENPMNKNIVINKQHEPSSELVRTSLKINKQLIMYKERTIPNNDSERQVSSIAPVTQSKDSVENLMSIMIH